MFVCLYVHITLGFYPVQQSVFLFNTEWFHCFSLFTVSTIGPNRENSEVRCLAWCNAPVLSHITGLKVFVLTPAVRVCRVRAVKRENNSFRLPFLTSHCQQCFKAPILQRGHWIFFSELGKGFWLLNWTRNVRELQYEMDEELNLQTDWLTKRISYRGTQRQFLENICSEDDLRSRIFGTFVAKFLACLPLLGFSNI